MVAYAKQEYDEKKESLSCREKAVARRELDLKTEIETRAADMVNDHIRTLDKEKEMFCFKQKAKYEMATGGYIGMSYFTLIYSVVITLLTAVLSPQKR